MGSLLKICKSIIKKNKSFSIGLLIMSTLSIAIGILGGNIGESAKRSILDYVESNNLPDIVYTTELEESSWEEELNNVDGIDHVYKRFVYESFIELENNDVYPTRIYSHDFNKGYNITLFDVIDLPSNELECYIPVKFAENHGIKSGEKVFVGSPFGDFTFTIAGQYLSVDTLYADKDFMSYHEGYSYCNLFIDYEDLAKKVTESEIDINKYGNQWFIYYEDNLSSLEIENVKAQCKSIFKEQLLSTKTFESSSNTLIGLKNDIKSITLIGIFFAALTFLISFGFYFIFVRIIVKKERKTVGLLRAIGYEKKEIVKLFSLYSLIINLLAIVVGIPLGYGLLRLGLFAFQNSEKVPFNHVATSPLILILICVISILVGLISSSISSLSMAKIDPSEAYGNEQESNNDNVKALRNFKGNEFVKISLSSIFKTIKRQIIGALCITACIVFMFTGIEGYVAVRAPTQEVYGKRFLYDISLRSMDKDDFDDISNNVTGIETIEEVVYFPSKLGNENIKITALKDDAELVYLRDTKGNRIRPGHGIIVDEVHANRFNIHVGDIIKLGDYEIEVSGIAREILFNVCYVSLSTAERMGHGEINGAMIKVINEDDINIVGRQIFDLNNSIYLVKTIDQYNYLNGRYVEMAIVLLILSLISFGIGLLLVANMSMIDFLEKRQKYATLRSIGYFTSKLTVINLIENLIRVVAGIVIGIPAAYLSASILLNVLSSSTSVTYLMSGFVPIIAITSGLCLIYVLIGVLITSRKIKSLDLTYFLNFNE